MMIPSRVTDNIHYEPNSGCWLWAGWGSTRYGRMYHPDTKKKITAHRFIYEETRGDIPEGKELDHLCRNTWCVNPSHLEPVTHIENVRRGVRKNPNGYGSHNRNKTHCPQGHEYSLENTYIHKDGSRDCVTCRKASALGRPNRNGYIKLKNR